MGVCEPRDIKKVRNERNEINERNKSKIGTNKGHKNLYIYNGNIINILRNMRIKYDTSI